MSAYKYNKYEENWQENVEKLISGKRVTQKETVGHNVFFIIKYIQI